MIDTTKFRILRNNKGWLVDLWPTGETFQRDNLWEAVQLFWIRFWRSKEYK